MPVIDFTDHDLVLWLFLMISSAFSQNHEYNSIDGRSADKYG